MTRFRNGSSLTINKIDQRAESRPKKLQGKSYALRIDIGGKTWQQGLECRRAAARLEDWTRNVISRTEVGSCSGQKRLNASRSEESQASGSRFVMLL